jgi:hypothetical protein
MQQAILIVFACSLLTPYTSALAQPNCDSILIPTKIDETLTREQELALATLVDSQQEYDQFTSAGAEGSYGLFSAGGNWENSKNQRDSLLEQKNLKFTDSEARRLVASFLPPEAAQAWADCIIGQEGGLNLRVSNVTPRNVTVTVTWEPLTNSSYGELQTLDIIGSKVTSDDLRRKLPDKWLKQSYPLIIEREPGAELRIVIAISGKSDDVFVPGVLPDVNQPKPSRGDVYDAATEGNMELLKRYFSSGFPINGIIDNQRNRTLHRIAEYCYDKLAAWLVGQGAAPNVENVWKDTPLEVAVLRCPTRENPDPNNATAKAIRGG